MAEFQTTTCGDIIDEIKPLLTKHWEEIALYRDRVPLDVNYDAYIALEKANMLKVFIVREAGALIGYAVYFMRRHPHYQSTNWAMNDIYWIDPAHRNAGIGIGLFRFVEDWFRSQLKPGELLVMHTNSKTMHPQAHRVLEFLGHDMVEVGHSKLLTGV
jgi:GNAT superfamily N-acetyltransferase